MCGISGIFSYKSPPTKQELQQMNRCLHHRGPDDSGYFLEPPMGLAHRRLSIVGLESGDQPISNEDGSIVVVFNGEIYNYPTLQAELREAGHSFSTDTDTEVLVHMYEEYGYEFVSRLEGMFSFALWDRNDDLLFLARDSMGIKPLLFANDGQRIAFGSELPAILRSDVNHGELDRRGLSEYFALGYVPAPRTPFENVEKVRPGECLVVSVEGVNRHRFYNMDIEPVSHSFSTASKKLRDRLTASVRKRLMSDVPLGTFLSSGIDSTILTGLMSQLHDDPIQTFTIGFERDRFDESDLARQVAQYHGTDHTEYEVSAKDVFETIPAVLGELGEPFADPSLLPTYIVSRETSRNIKVALSGDGADELFAGYNRYRGEYYSTYYRRLPRSIRSMLVEPVVNRLPASRSSKTGELIRKGQKFVEIDAPGVSDRHFEWVQKIPHEALEVYQNCDPTIDGKSVLIEAHKRLNDCYPDERQQPLSEILAVDVQHGLPNQMLRKVDLASMYNSLEVRVPFLDLAVVKYAQGLPLEYKITATDRKRILKHAFDDLIPEAVRSQPKQGFDMPIGEWFKHELKANFESIVTEVDLPLLDAHAVLNLHQRHISGRQDYEWFLWNVYVFAHWYQQMEEEGHIR